MIGTGSIGFTRRLMRDLLAVPEFVDTTFASTDLSEQNLDMVIQLCKAMLHDPLGESCATRQNDSLIAILTEKNRRKQGRFLRFFVKLD